MKKINQSLSVTHPTMWEMLFQSGFGGTTRLMPAAGADFHGAPDQYEDILGADSQTLCPLAWNEFSRHPNLGHLRLYYEGGEISQRSASIQPDESNPLKKILRFTLSEPNVTIHWPTGPEHKARVQAEMYGNNNLRELYQTVKLRLHSDVRILEQFPSRIHWFTLFEFWNQPFWNDYPFPFRISISLRKPSNRIGEELIFAAEAQKMLNPQTFETLWHVEFEPFKVPYSQWMNLEIYYREGSQETGRLYLAITPEGGKRQVVFDVHDFTHHPDNPSPSGLTHYNPMKLYTSAKLVEFVRDRGGALRLDWDDFSLWKGRQPPDLIQDSQGSRRVVENKSRIVAGGGV